MCEDFYKVDSGVSALINFPKLIMPLRQNIKYCEHVQYLHKNTSKKGKGLQHTYGMCCILNNWRRSLNL